jgi:osmoprotectant transport system ATP-binding protein
VIQQIGLFPHMTIADNIAVVPELKGWDKQRTSTRIDELLAMVGLEPADFRDRYPRELSGGQRQRVGVARALAADPPVMLMDEPFGAIDPITREHLQNEFLRLQKRINKTIIFVTHDIDEAIKMGTLIAILQVGGILEQLDSPSNILAQPANEFVADFVGADRGLKRLNLVRVGTVMHSDMSLARADNDASEALALMNKEKVDSILVVDDADRLVGYLAREVAEANPNKKAGALAREVVTFTQEEATMKDAFSEMLSSGVGYMPVVGDKKKVLGIVKATDAQRLIEDGPQA